MFFIETEGFKATELLSTQDVEASSLLLPCLFFLSLLFRTSFSALSILVSSLQVLLFALLLIRDVLSGACGLQ